VSSGPLPTKITLTAQARDELEAVIRKATSPQREVFRSQIVLLAAQGLNNTDIGRRLECTRKTVRKWRDRYASEGRAGLKDEPRPGRPPIYGDSERALITALACELPGSRNLPFSRLSTADLHEYAARELDPCPSRSTIAAWLGQAAIRPWTYTSWVTPRDPLFEQKARPVLDLYNGIWDGQELTDRDIIICADEKTGIQARSRRRSPPGPGTPIHVEHEYKRHGVCVYQTAYIVGTGEVIGHCVARNTRANFESLIESVMSHTLCRSAERVFLILDNGSAHHPATFASWIAKAYPTVEVLHLPKGASWLNQIELYFSVLVRKALAGESFSSVDAVMDRIIGFEELWNRDPTPFEWSYTSSELADLLAELPAIE
jgi:transposase